MKLVIFHYNPLEKFPPAMNLLRILDERMDGENEAIVFTTAAPRVQQLYIPANPRIKIKRLGLHGIHQSALLRLVGYLRYFGMSFLQSLLIRPSRLFYYESVSSLVPVVLKKFFIPKARLLLHYHEYMSPADYRESSLVNSFHRLERVIYPEAAWISQTNSQRMRFFLEDTGLPANNRMHVVPNYPLRSWGRPKSVERVSPQVRLVYVGSFGSTETLYIKETLEWIKSLQGKGTLDIYSFNMPETVAAFVKSLQCEHIRVLPEVSYYELPAVLNRYDVGLILYKGLSRNFEYNAPNKLFEYLACGLDVWYPKTLKGIQEYDTANTWPQVRSLNFEALETYDIMSMTDRSTSVKNVSAYSYEDAAAELVQQLVD